MQPYCSKCRSGRHFLLFQFLSILFTNFMTTQYSCSIDRKKQSETRTASRVVKRQCEMRKNPFLRTYIRSSFPPSTLHRSHFDISMTKTTTKDGKYQERERTAVRTNSSEAVSACSFRSFNTACATEEPFGERPVLSIDRIQSVVSNRKSVKASSETEITKHVIFKIRPPRLRKSCLAMEEIPALW